MTNLSRYSPQAIALLRIVAALLFMEHGTQKLFAFPVPMEGMTIAAGSMIWFAGVLEFFGGALLALGLFTRPVAFLLSGEMAVAYWTTHAPHSFFPVLNDGDPAILYCFIFLMLVFTGAGAFSLDSKIGSTWLGGEHRSGKPVGAS